MNPEPPSLIGSLLAGFDSIANHISLILFPLVLDIYLWMGPRLKLQALVSDVVKQLTSLPGLDSSEAEESVRLTQEIWMFLAERLNLFAALRSYPVGIPSLMAGRLPISSPAGEPLTWDMGSIAPIIAIWLGITLVGLVTGTLFYEVVSQVSLSGAVNWREVLGEWGRKSIEVILLAVFLVAVLIAILLPVSCVVSVLSLASLQLGQLGALLIGGVLIWSIFPLFFSAHGIFVYKQRMWISLRRGAGLTRMTFVRTGILFILIILISEGLNTLWNVPPETSWLAFIGLAGHAFVSTSLLAASFIYYRDATRWVQRLVQQAALVDQDKGRLKIKI